MPTASKRFVAAALHHCRWLPCPPSASTLSSEDGTQQQYLEDLPAVLAGWSEDAKVGWLAACVPCVPTAALCSPLTDPPFPQHTHPHSTPLAAHTHTQQHNVFGVADVRVDVGSGDIQDMQYKKALIHDDKATDLQVG